MKKNKTKEIEVKNIFAEDGMFLADDGKLYRYQIENGIVKVYKKSSKTNVIETRYYNYPDNGRESDFWLVRKNHQELYLKKKDGLLEPVTSIWGTRGGDHSPVIYGDLLFVITDLTWADTNPYSERTEPTYKILKAKWDGSGYTDITNSISPPESRIVRVDKNFSDKVNIYFKHKNNLASSQRSPDKTVQISYKRRYKLQRKEHIEWKLVRNFSEKTKLSLLQIENKK